jgi:hypothetical protein
LVFTDKCTLRIIRTLSDGTTNRIWSNIHEWFDNFSADEYPGLDNVLAKGEITPTPLRITAASVGRVLTFVTMHPFLSPCNMIAIWWCL